MNYPEEKLGSLYRHLAALDVLAEGAVANGLYLQARDICTQQIAHLLEDRSLREAVARQARRSDVATDAAGLTVMSRIALRFIPEFRMPTDTLPAILHGDPASVSERLTGWTLRHGQFAATIGNVLPQDAVQNSRWVGTRPIFGSQPSNGMVSLYRGNPMLFLRCSEPDTCVRIISAQVGDMTANNAKQVCSLLGLTEEAVLGVEATDECVLDLRVLT